MGLIQSLLCSVTFCIERVLTWACCALLLILLMFTLVVLMIYGISVGYHYAQKELASFAMASRSTTAEPSAARTQSELRAGPDSRPVVRLIAVNKTETDQQTHNLPAAYRTDKPKENVYMDTSEVPVVILETDRTPAQPVLSPRERELARKLIGRFRRSRNGTEPNYKYLYYVPELTEVPFLRPLRNRTNLSPFAVT